MSGTIDIFKLKFSVFGHGFEDARADSGDGSVVINEKIPFLSEYGAIDSTGQFVWLASSDGIRKYDLETLEEVSQSSVPRNTNSRLYHPNNVANNYGLIWQGTDFYLIDLTSDAVIKSGTVNVSFSYADCIYVNNEFRFVELGQGRTQNYIHIIQYSDLSVVTHAFDNWQTGSLGWVSDDKIQAYFVPEWFYIKRQMKGVDIDGVTQWYVEAQTAGAGGFPNINSEGGFGANGYMWIPCYKYGKWRMGAFPWSGADDFETPKPVKVFGTFPSVPSFIPYSKYAVAHNTGRTKVAFATNLGVYLGDYHELYKVTDVIIFPVALHDNTVVCTDGTDTYIFKG